MGGDHNLFRVFDGHGQEVFASRLVSYRFFRDRRKFLVLARIDYRRGFQTLLPDGYYVMVSANGGNG